MKILIFSCHASNTHKVLIISEKKFFRTNINFSCFKLWTWDVYITGMVSRKRSRQSFPGLHLCIYRYTIIQSAAKLIFENWNNHYLFAGILASLWFFSKTPVYEHTSLVTNIKSEGSQKTRHDVRNGNCIT